MHHDVTQVKPLGHLRLAVWFRDGLRGEVELRESHLYGVFEALKDPELFQHVHCDQGFVERPGELDLAPDARYEAIKQHGRWILEQAMTRPFDPKQPYQLDAVTTGADLCDGQPRGVPE